MGNTDDFDYQDDKDSPEAKLSALMNARNGASKKKKIETKAAQKAMDGLEETGLERFEARKDEGQDASEFNFEIIKHYPLTRSFQIKKPLKKSFTDSVFDLLGKQ